MSEESGHAARPLTAPYILDDAQAPHLTEACRSVLRSKSAITVLELGAGMGAVSIVLGALRSGLESGAGGKDRIITTDLCK